MIYMNSKKFIHREGSVMQTCSPTNIMPDSGASDCNKDSKV